MPDVALSTVTSSPLAALLSGAATDSKTSKGGDPFAALLAHAGGKGASTTKTGASDAVAALLAGTAAPAPVLPTTTPTTPIAPEAAAEALPADADAEIAAPKGKSEDADEDKDGDDDTDDGTDKLADAIASGATAVLALAPAIVAPIQAPTTPDVPVQAKIDGAATPRSLKLMATPMAGNAGTRGADNGAQTRFDADADARAQQQAPRPDAIADAAQTNTTLSPDAAKAVTAALQQRSTLQPAQTLSRDVQPATDAKPAATDGASAQVASVATAILPQADAKPVPVASADPTTAQAAAVARKPQTAPSSQIQPRSATQPAQAQAQAASTPAPSQTHRRSDESTAPRRSGEARRRSDSGAIDPALAGASQNGASRVEATISRPVTAVDGKGDTMVEQTLTIAKDGAWLDSLAKDIANAGSGNDLHFKLAPENLGALSVSISQKDEGASIRLTADNQQTRDILVDAQPKLIAEARAQGLKVSDAQVDVKQDQNQSQNQSANQDSQRWAQQQTGQQAASQQGQNRQSSPDHKPFVSNLARKAEAESESSDGDSDGLYA